MSWPDLETLAEAIPDDLPISREQLAVMILERAACNERHAAEREPRPDADALLALLASWCRLAREALDDEREADFEAAVHSLAYDADRLARLVRHW